MRVWQMKTKSKYFPDIVRTLVLVVIGCLVAVKGRDWLIEWWGIRLSPGLYFCIAYLFVAFVVWIATAKLLNELRTESMDLQERQVSFSDIPIRAKNEGKAVYRYPLRVVCLAVAISAIFIIIPAISGNPARPISLVGYLMCFGFATMVIIYAAYLFKFSVRIDETSVEVHGFTKKTFLLKDVLEVKLRRDKGSLRAVVKLTNGGTFSFSGMLKDFSSLTQTLRAKFRQDETVAT